LSRNQGVAAVKPAQGAHDAARDNVEVTRAQQNERLHGHGRRGIDSDETTFTDPSPPGGSDSYGDIFVILTLFWVALSLLTILPKKPASTTTEALERLPSSRSITAGSERG
jgi:hypothetical protein